MTHHTAVSAPAFDHTAFDTLLERIAAGSAARDRDRILPFEEIAALKALRFGAFRLPLAQGGTGATFRELFTQVIRLAAADANIAHILRNHFVFVERFTRGEDERARFWRGEVARGAIFGLANSDIPGSVPTVLARAGDSWSLSGEKGYSTGTLFADYVIARIALEDGRTGTAILPTDRPGVERIDDWDAAGQRLTGSGTTRFTGAEVRDSEIVLDGDDSPYDHPYKSTLPQLFLTVVNAGILQAIARDGLALLNARRGRRFYFAPVDEAGSDPIQQQGLGEILSAAFAAEATVLAAADQQDRIAAGPAGDFALAHEGARLAALAKITVDRLTTEAATRLFDLGGASSTRRDLNLDRHWRNARTLAAHNPATHKAYAVAAQALNGTPLPNRGFF